MSWCCNVTFSINEARRFPALGKELHDVVVERTPGVFRGHWLALGRYDHICVTLAKKAEDLLAVERKVQDSSFASSHWSCYGRVLAASEGWDLEQRPGPPGRAGLIGICGIKLSARVRMQMHSLEAFAVALRGQLSTISGQWLLSSTTGWEDAMLLFWSDSFSHISAAASAVRRLPTRLIEGCEAGAGVHATLTTCTIPGIVIADDFLAPDHTLRSRQWLEKLLPQVAVVEEIDWVTRFELRPGHLDSFVSLLRADMKRVVPEVDYQLAKVFGQYDLRIQCQNSSHDEWLKFIIEIALPLATRAGSLVRAMETLPQIKVSDGPFTASFSEGESNDSITPPGESPSDKLGREMDTIKKHCEAAGVAPHTIAVLRATRARLASLSDDDLLRGTFRSVERIYESLAEGLSVPRADGTLLPLDERRISLWLYYVERCLADRYRGTYPIGDALVPRLGSYQASHHAFLQAADTLAQSASDLAIDVIQEHMKDAKVEAKLPLVAICCQIGNSPSPNAMSLIERMHCGYIELPAAMVFRMRDIPSLIHEVGHVVANTLMAYLPLEKLRTEDEKERTAVAEILAEAFSRTVCFSGNARQHREAMEQILSGYLPDKKNSFTPGTSFVYSFRLTAVQWLLGKKWTEGTTGLDIEQKFFSHCWSDVKALLKPDEEDRVFQEVTTVAKAMRRLARSYDEDTSFRAYVDALNALAKQETLEARPAAVPVIRLRKFIADKAAAEPSAGDVAEDFRVIEELCLPPGAAVPPPRPFRGKVEMPDDRPEGR